MVPFFALWAHHHFITRIWQSTQAKKRIRDFKNGPSSYNAGPLPNNEIFLSQMQVLRMRTEGDLRVHYSWKVTTFAKSMCKCQRVQITTRPISLLLDIWKHKIHIMSRTVENSSNGLLGTWGNVTSPHAFIDLFWEPCLPAFRFEGQTVSVCLGWPFGLICGTVVMSSRSCLMLMFGMCCWECPCIEN